MGMSRTEGSPERRRRAHYFPELNASTFKGSVIRLLHSHDRVIKFGHSTAWDIESRAHGRPLRVRRCMSNTATVVSLSIKRGGSSVVAKCDHCAMVWPSRRYLRQLGSRCI